MKCERKSVSAQRKVPLRAPIDFSHITMLLGDWRKRWGRIAFNRKYKGQVFTKPIKNVDSKLVKRIN
jgi:hypothetical protein